MYLYGGRERANEREKSMELNLLNGSNVDGCVCELFFISVNIWKVFKCLNMHEKIERIESSNNGNITMDAGYRCSYQRSENQSNQRDRFYV